MWNFAEYLALFGNELPESVAYPIVILLQLVVYILRYVVNQLFDNNRYSPNVDDPNNGDGFSLSRDDTGIFCKTVIDRIFYHFSDVDGG